MDVRVDVRYRLDLSREEWLVVNKALRVFAGVSPAPLIADVDRQIAATLQEQMIVQKHNVLSQMANDASKAVANVEAAKVVEVAAKPTRESKR